MSSATKTGLILIAAGIAGFIIVRKLMPAPSLVKAATGPAKGKEQSVFLGGLINSGLSALGGYLGSKDDRANNIADRVAAEDSLSGVVGFGGWDANSLADSTAASDTASGVVGFGGWD